MAFTGLTPEALLERSDSKNPATTCKGITKLGRPCRNPISFDPAKINGVLAVASVVSDSDDEEIGAAAFFCHKHKDQAEQLVAANATGGGNGPKRQNTHIYPLQNRSSIDTLVARLGVLEVAESSQQTEQQGKSREKTDGNRPRRSVNRPPTWDRVQGPFMEVPSDLMNQRPTQGPTKPKKTGFWESLCCGTADEHDYVEVVRHKKRMSHNQQPAMSQYTQQVPIQPARPYQAQSTRPIGSGPAQRMSNASRPVSALPGRKTLGEKPARPVNQTSPTPRSETTSLLSYIPKTLSPQKMSLLLTELSKPISPHDEEGYIYIFWLTPESAGPAPSSTASNLLAPPSRPEQGRRTSDVLRQYSVRRPQRPTPNKPRRKSAVGDDVVDDKNTILLKIGRANNVHRRMNEWTRQCGYSLSLVRFYPYVPSGSTPSPSPHPSPRNSPRRQSYGMNVSPGPGQRPTDTNRRTSSTGVRKVPHAHRVERLIHLELAEQRVKKQCEACGKEHREWFEVEATRDGVKQIDEVVKRWVTWAENAEDIP